MNFEKRRRRFQKNRSLRVPSSQKMYDRYTPVNNLRRFKSSNESCTACADSNNADKNISAQSSSPQFSSKPTTQSLFFCFQTTEDRQASDFQSEDPSTIHLSPSENQSHSQQTTHFCNTDDTSEDQSKNSLIDNINLSEEYNWSSKSSQSDTGEKGPNMLCNDMCNCNGCRYAYACCCHNKGSSRTCNTSDACPDNETLGHDSELKPDTSSSFNDCDLIKSDNIETPAAVLEPSLKSENSSNDPEKEIFNKEMSPAPPKQDWKAVDGPTNKVVPPPVVLVTTSSSILIARNSEPDQPGSLKIDEKDSKNIPIKKTIKKKRNLKKIVPLERKSSKINDDRQKSSVCKYSGFLSDMFSSFLNAFNPSDRNRTEPLESAHFSSHTTASSSVFSPMPRFPARFASCSSSGASDTITENTNMCLQPTFVFIKYAKVYVDPEDLDNEKSSLSKIIKQSKKRKRTNKYSDSSPESKIKKKKKRTRDKKNRKKAQNKSPCLFDLRRKYDDPGPSTREGRKSFFVPCSDIFRKVESSREKPPKKKRK